MNTQPIIDVCKRYKIFFEKIIKDVPYENKGIFNSEMLLFCALSNYFKVSEIWESGRARGQSTKIIAEIYKGTDVKIHSIELLKDTEDSEIAEKRLKDYTNLDIKYGQSKIIIPENINKQKNTSVLIDGPKGMEAINLAGKLLENTNVKLVFLHDYHKDSPLRKVVKERFPNSFFTDNNDYVEEFKDLDDNCWIEHNKVCRYPYRRGNRTMQSYSSTLCVIFNI